MKKDEPETATVSEKVRLFENAKDKKLDAEPIKVDRSKNSRSQIQKLAKKTTRLRRIAVKDSP